MIDYKSKSPSIEYNILKNWHVASAAISLVQSAERIVRLSALRLKFEHEWQN